MIVRENVMRSYSIFPIGSILLISIQEEIDDHGITDLIREVSTAVQDREIRGVIIDLHDVEVVDTYLAQHIVSLSATLKLQRARTVIAGLAVPVVITLLDFGIRLQGLEFALDVEQAIEKLEKGIG